MTVGPLAGTSVLVDAGEVVSRTEIGVACRHLIGLGAEIVDDARSAHQVRLSQTDDTDRPAVALTGCAPDDLAHLDGLPGRTISYAVGLAVAAAAVVALLADDDVDVDVRSVALQVLLPISMAASYGTRHREPPSPYPIGDGWVVGDFAGDDDRRTFERLLESLGAAADDPITVANEAQSWRLPVCAVAARGPIAPDADRPVCRFRPRSARTTHQPTPAPLTGVVVCDLTSMWAGPLTTYLLASIGADVTKVEAGLRPDGLRAFDGMGIHPPGVNPEPGNASGMFNALNRGKHRTDLDLRHAGPRRHFESLVERSDIVIDSFSRRVMPNLGYPPEYLRLVRPGVISASITAFPSGHPWQVALGPGIHAASGLADAGTNGVAMPTVAYPDPLTGLAAFLDILASLWSARHGHDPGHRETTMTGVTAGLASLDATTSPLLHRDPGLGAWLLNDVAMRSAWEFVSDGAGRHRYPRAPLTGSWKPTVLTPAPRFSSTALQPSPVGAGPPGGRA